MDAQHQDLPSLTQKIQSPIVQEPQAPLKENFLAPEEQSKHDICSGCQEPAEISDPTTCIPQCTHRFHQQCLAPWLKKDQSCPVCRNPLTVYYKMEGKTIELPKISQKPKKESATERLLNEIRYRQYWDGQMDSDDEEFQEEDISEMFDSEIDSESVIVFSCGEESEQDSENKNLRRLKPMLKKNEKEKTKKIKKRERCVRKKGGNKKERKPRQKTERKRKPSQKKKKETPPLVEVRSEPIKMERQ